jgi:hypothetical protein
MCFETQTCSKPPLPFIEVFTLLGCYTAVIGSYRRFGTAYQFRLAESSMDCLTLEDVTDRLFHNTSKHCVTSQKSEDLIYTATES